MQLKGFVSVWNNVYLNKTKIIRITYRMELNYKQFINSSRRILFSILPVHFSCLIISFFFYQFLFSFHLPSTRVLTAVYFQVCLASVVFLLCGGTEEKKRMKIIRAKACGVAARAFWFAIFSHLSGPDSNLFMYSFFSSLVSTPEGARWRLSKGEVRLSFTHVALQ